MEITEEIQKEAHRIFSSKGGKASARVQGKKKLSENGKKGAEIRFSKKEK